MIRQNRTGDLCIAVARQNGRASGTGMSFDAEGTIERGQSFARSDESDLTARAHELARDDFLPSFDELDLLCSREQGHKGNLSQGRAQGPGRCAQPTGLLERSYSVRAPAFSASGLARCSNLPAALYSMGAGSFCHRCAAPGDWRAAALPGGELFRARAYDQGADALEGLADPIETVVAHEA